MWHTRSMKLSRMRGAVSVATQVSLDEFLANPDIHYYDFHELHNGEVVLVSPPSIEHLALQVRLEIELRSLLARLSYDVFREFYYTLASNSRRADVAVVAQGRLQMNRAKVFRGGPDLLIEVLSPSNTTMDLDKLRSECFQEETREFWQINQALKTVTVYRGVHTVAVYGEGDRGIPLDAFQAGAVLPMDAVFVTA